MKQSDELRELVLGFYQAMETADMSYFESRLSQEEGVISIGTDPEEWWADHKVIAKVYEAQLKEMKGFSIVGANPQAFSDGNVGWVADQYKVNFPDGNAVSFRMTMVWQKEASKWKIIQAHASVGVPNEQLLGYALPTG